MRHAGWLLLAAAALAAGCGGIRVRERGPADLLDAWRDSLTAGQRPSPRTEQTLRRWDVADLYRRDPDAACARLHAAAAAEPLPELLFALAELYHQRGEQAGGGPAAVAHFYLSAGYAFHYLFVTSEKAPERLAAAVPLSPADAFDPRFRLACDLYNAGLARCLDAARRCGRLDPHGLLRLPAADGAALRVPVVPVNCPWRPDEIGALRACDELSVSGLANHYRTYGLGVPMLATRADDAPPPAPARYPPGVSFPVTAFFCFEGGLGDLRAGRGGRLELHNPLAAHTAVVRGRAVPLETDLTTPLAWTLASGDFGALPLGGFFRPEAERDRAGLYMLQPYQPGKVPVVMVHGLASSPLTWAPLFNDLRADGELRRRCQFWFYSYPTGNPYLIAAADLRRDLARMRAAVDPNRADPAWDSLVLVGHSMGGLVSHLLTEDSGDDFWRLASARPLAEVPLRPQTRDEVERVFYFRRVPEVRRVVFLGTPHHGSSLSPGLAGRLADSFVRLPTGLVADAEDLAREDPDLTPALRGGRLPTSVDLLAPKSPALELIAARPRPPRVHYHSVIGVAPPSATRLERWFGGDGEPGDGVVPYASAHLDGVDSEVVVPADHFTVHHHPLAVMEVRRILHEHLRTMDAPE
jgi:hypothetical protein